MFTKVWCDGGGTRFVHSRSQTDAGIDKVCGRQAAVVAAEARWVSSTGKKPQADHGGNRKAL